jgi:hypothetical protein
LVVGGYLYSICADLHQIETTLHQKNGLLKRVR